MKTLDPDVCMPMDSISLEKIAVTNAVARFIQLTRLLKPLV